MIGPLLEALWQPLSAVAVALAAIIGAWLAGRRAARSEREAEDAKEYRNERQKIDDELSGIGGTDADRIERLRDIANRRGSGKD